MATNSPASRDGSSKNRDLSEARKHSDLWPFWISTILVLVSGLAITLGSTFIVLAAMGLPAIEQRAVVPAGDLVGILRIALFVTAGVGGIVTLLVVYRRQKVAEAAHEIAVESHAFDQEIRRSAHSLQVNVATEEQRQATEKHITEMFTSAVEHLGSNSAAQRLGSVYSLERIGQGHPAFRQTIIDVLCAYLRLPFTPRWFPSKATETRTDAELAEVLDETHVRIAIQRMMHSHLVPDGVDISQMSYRVEDGGRLRRHMQDFTYGRLAIGIDREATFWEAVHLDLRHSTLVDLDLRGVRLASIDLKGARMAGNAYFDGLHVDREAAFSGIRFYGSAHFNNCAFPGGAYFYKSRFRKGAFFSGSQFAHADFVDTSFRGTASFRHCAISDGNFDGSTFHDNVSFLDTSFDSVEFGIAAFWYLTVRRQGTQFRGSAEFDNCRFFGRTSFYRSKFRATPKFKDARYAGDDYRQWPDGFKEEQGRIAAG